MKVSEHRELVINWHVTEVCNYSCQYCYAKWDKRGSELIHDIEKAGQLLEQIYAYFSNYRLENNQYVDSIRLNFAGGEPLLYPSKTTSLIKLASGIGFNTSIITNGSRLNLPLMLEIAPHISVLGISLDSLKNSTNREIGRADRHARVLEIGNLINVIEAGRQTSPRLRLKIDTVVNSQNWREDMNPSIFHLSPDKWKILRMLPTVTDRLAVSDSEFEAFVQRHSSLEKIITVEDNVDMTESYIMIDPLGRFFQNIGDQKGYRYSHSILEAGVESAFSQVSWSPEKFCSRYVDQHGKSV